MRFFSINPKECRFFARLSSIENHSRALLPLLSIQELDTAWSFPSHTRSLEFIAGRTIVKICLRHLLGINYSQVDIRRDISSRPLLHIDGNLVDDVHIAISHGGDYVYCAASSEAKIGLDVEPISEKLFEIRQLWTTPEECCQIASQSIDKRSRDGNFTRLWSSKECLAKYLDVSLDHVINHAHLERFAGNQVILQYANDHKRLNIKCETVLRRGHIFAFLSIPLN